MSRSVVGIVLAVFAAITLFVACEPSPNSGESESATTKPADLKLPGYFLDRKKPHALVFVHGIWGDGWGTWYNATTKAYWPRLIESDSAFADFDVYVYDYRTKFREDTIQIPDLATELFTRINDARLFETHDDVSFVTHSMGGLLTRALLLDHRDWAAKTRVIFFLATPTLGAPPAGMLRGGIENVTVTGLKGITANAFLLQQSNSWRLARFDIRSHCGFETDDTAIVRVVERTSAEALCTEPSNPIRGNHFDVVKPANLDALQHVALRGALRSVSTPVPPPGPPVMETRWNRIDASGRMYKQTFVHRTENRHGRADIVATGADILSSSEGRIYRVDYTCVGFPCGWSYSPDGGYGGKTVVQGDGRAFLWWRRWDGDPCDDVYTAYYEVPSQVCVSNCPDESRDRRRGAGR